MKLDRIVNVLNKVREKNPLVHNITNVVVTNFTANGLLALGASPVMAYAREEVADMARIAGAVVLNMGTLDQNVVEAMRLAARSAHEHGVPVVFDPVGAGATPYRTETACTFMQEVGASILRGNAPEVANVIGKSLQMKGVDAAAEAQDAGELAIEAARALKCVVVITGQSDYVSDGTVTYRIDNGTPVFTKVTGTGCLLSSVIGAFAAVEQDHVLAAASALAYYSVAGEEALKLSGPAHIGTFQVELLNQLHLVDGALLSKAARIKRI